MPRKARAVCILIHKAAYEMVLHVGEIVIHIIRLDLEALVELRVRGVEQLLEPVHQLGKARARACADRHHGNAKLKREALAIDAIAALFDLIHHVEGDDHRPLEFEQLDGEVEVALKIRAVDNVDDRLGFFVDDVIARNDLLHRIRGERIDARKIHDRHLMPERAKARAVVGRGFNFAFFFLHRHARPVTYIFASAGHGVEERGLAAVGVARKRKAHGAAVVPKDLARAIIADAPLATASFFEDERRQLRRAAVARRVALPGLGF